MTERTPPDDDATIVVYSESSATNQETHVAQSPFPLSITANPGDPAPGVHHDDFTGADIDNDVSSLSDAARHLIQPIAHRMQLDSQSSSRDTFLDVDSTAMNISLATEDQANFDLFVRTSEQSFFSNDEFNDLDFFELLPGLPPNQIPQFGFPNTSGGFDGFSPLEQYQIIDPTLTTEVSDPVRNPQQEDLQELDEYLGTQTRDIPLKHASKRTSNLPDSVNVRLPQIVQDAPAKQPMLLFNERIRTALIADLTSRFPAEQSATFSLMSAASLQKCLRTYVDCFHVHLPLFHLHTLDLEHTPSPLLLSMCAIGALFRLERRVAVSLYGMATQSIQSVLLDTGNVITIPNSLEEWVRPRRDSTTSNWRPLWVTQCKLLMTFFAAFSGDPVVIRKATEGVGMLSSVCSRLLNIWVGTDTVIGLPCQYRLGKTRTYCSQRPLMASMDTQGDHQKVNGTYKLGNDALIYSQAVVCNIHLE